MGPGGFRIKDVGMVTDCTYRIKVSTWHSKLVHPVAKARISD